MKSKAFPIETKKGSARVRVYRVSHKKTKSGWVYPVAWYIGPIRKLKQFADLEEAKKFAKQRATILASGDSTGIETTKRDLEEYQAAKELAYPTPLLSALEEWKRAKDICGGQLIAAVESWRDRNGTATISMRAAQAVELFIAAKIKQGVDVSASYSRHLPPFKKQFETLSLDSITATMLQTWLDKHYSNTTSRNTARKRIVTLFRWARKMGYLPRDAMTEAEQTEAAREEASEIGIISPSTLRKAFKLIREKAPEYLPALAVAVFAGLRRSEVHGQTWEDIELDRKFLKVTKAKRGTPARRLVPLCDSAVKVLQRQKGEGPLCSNLAIDRIRKILKTAKLELPDNCFRHSFISYRVAQTGNIPETSLEAGNSVRVIHRHYRELATKEDAEEWFNAS